MKTFKLRNLVAALMVAGAVGAQAAVIYSQSDYSTGGFFSDGVAGQFYDNRMAENFTIGGAATVNTITWAGGSENFLDPTLGNFSDWVIRIFNDSAGAVGTEVWSGTFAKAATNPVFTGSFNVAGGEIHTQSVATGGVGLGAGSYWISIGSVNISPGDDAWAWADTLSVYDGAARSDSPFGSGFGTVEATDLSFGLEGVPEPGTFVALGVGLAGLVAMRRRK